MIRRYKQASSDGTEIFISEEDFIALRKKSKARTNKPAIATRANNLRKAMFRWVAEGFPVETKEEANRRVAICETNECGFFNGSICLHQRCGCYANVKKFISTEHCPIGKW